MGTRKRVLGRLAVLGAMVALAAAGLGSPAHADDRLLDTDGVKVNAVGFDLGSGTYDNIDLSGTAPVSWLIDDNDVLPHVTGILHLAGVYDECARVRIDYYSSAGLYLTDRHGGTVCAPDNGWNRWSVDLSPYRSDKIGKVKVSIELQLPHGTFDIVGSDWATLNTFVDSSVQVSDNLGGGGVWGIGFGAIGWAAGNPLGGGQVVWNLSGGQIRPHLTGYLHMESAAGDCVRMRIDYYADDGPDAGTAYDHLGLIHGGRVCALDNSHHVWSVDLDGFSDSTVRHVRVAIEEQTSATTWQVIDSTYSYFGT